jgi:hypothetical protein
LPPLVFDYSGNTTSDSFNWLDTATEIFGLKTDDEATPASVATDNGRSSIKYKTEAFDLIFYVAPTTT